MPDTICCGCAIEGTGIPQKQTGNVARYIRMWGMWHTSQTRTTSRFPRGTAAGVYTIPLILCVFNLTAYQTATMGEMETSLGCC